MAKRRSPRIITAAGVIAVLTIMGTVLALDWPVPGQDGSARAHDDGTLHIHPTLTPTPTPAPTPAPLKGQPQLVSSVYYNRTTHALDLTSHVIDAPKREDGWRYDGNGQYTVGIDYQDWSARSSCYPVEYQEPADNTEMGVMQCSLPLPDHWDLERIRSSMLIPVHVSGPVFMREHGDITSFDLHATFYADLSVRDNWRE